MIIVDSALEQRHREGRPIRVAMVGAGFMGKGVALQLLRAPGIQLVAISNRTVERAEQAFREAGAPEVRRVDSVASLHRAMASGTPAVTEDSTVLTGAGGIDCILELTGAVEFGARVAVDALEQGKHLVTMNAELDGTVGPLLKTRAERAGVVFTGSDGDQPGVTMNLHRFVRGIGVRPVLCGNIKGLQDEYRNPTTQRGFAEQWGQNVHMVTSFADGTKVSFEQAIVANATGMSVAVRGMHGPEVERGTSVEEAPGWYPEEDLLSASGIVDYVVGASPGPGVFVIGTHDHPAQRHYLKLYKLGDGPYYVFYRPYHLCHFEVASSIARAVLFRDPTIAPLGAPLVDVVTTAKVDLEAGQVLDGLGGYHTYGQCENAPTARLERLLPMGLAEGCRLKRAVERDRTLTFDDVELPSGRLVDELWREQDHHFGLDPSGPSERRHSQPSLQEGGSSRA